MLVGYARTSTDDQAAGFEDQLVKLREHGCERVFSEQVSSVAEREQLNSALEYVRDGDVLVVTKLDRLARSISHLCKITETLNRKRVELRILGLGIDTSTPTGKAMLGMLGVIAELERDILLERQRVGIAAARRGGKYRGRKPTARAKTEQIRALVEAGISKSEAARRCGVGRSSVYRAL